MAKKVSAQVTVTVTGDGITSTNAPTPTANPLLGTSGGGETRALVVGNTVLTPPATTTVGVLIIPSVACVLQDATALGAIPIPAGLACFLSLVAPSTGIQINSVAPGTVFVQWV